MTYRWILVLFLLGLYLLIPFTMVVNWLRSGRGLTRGTEGERPWSKGFTGKLENCWTCASRFWFQLEPKAVAANKEPTEAPGLGAQSQISSEEVSCPLRRGKLVSKFCEIIPSTPAAVGTTLEKLMEVVKALPCAPDEIDDVELAVNEALANAILHGNQGDPTKKVVVACFCECDADGGLLLVVRDEGLGFDPSEISDPTTAERIHSTHGRGIFLMRQLMDEVRYRNGGAEVELRKRGGCSLAPGQSEELQ